jgi:O-antigen ligase
MNNSFLLIGLFLVFTTIAFGTIIKPAFGLAILIFALPLLSQGFRLYLGGQYPFISFETMAVFVLWVFAQFHNIRLRRQVEKDRGLVIATFIFLFAGLFSAFFAKDSELAFKILLVGAFSPLLCLNIARRHIRSKEDFKLVLFGYFGLVIQAGIYTLIVLKNRQGIFQEISYFASWQYQVGGIYSSPVTILPSPSVTIATIVGSIPFAAWYRVYGQKNNVVIWLVVTGFTIWVALMSLSRGSWLGVLVALIATLPFYFKTFQIKAIILLICLTIGLNISGFFDFFLQALNIRLSTQIDTLSIRLANYQLALQSSFIHPFIGLGLGNYLEIYRELPHTLAAKMEHLWFAHNLFLTLIPEIGLVGALAFGYIFISRIIKGIQLFQIQRDDSDHWLRYSLITTIVSYIVVVSTSGGHLIAVKTDYLTAPALIVIMTFMGCLTYNYGDLDRRNHLSDINHE